MYSSRTCEGQAIPAANVFELRENGQIMRDERVVKLKAAKHIGLTVQSKMLARATMS